MKYFILKQSKTQFLFLPHPNPTHHTTHSKIKTKPTEDLLLHLFLPVLGSSLKQILGLFYSLSEYFKIQDQHTFISHLLFLFSIYFFNDLIYFSTCLPTSGVAFSTEAYPLLPSSRHTLTHAFSIPPPSSHTIICLLCSPFFHSILCSKIQVQKQIPHHVKSLSSLSCFPPSPQPGMLAITKTHPSLSPFFCFSFLASLCPIH